MKLPEIHKQVGGFPFKAKDPFGKEYVFETVLSTGHYVGSHDCLEPVFFSHDSESWQLVSPKPAPRKLYATKHTINNEVRFWSQEPCLVEPISMTRHAYERAPEFDIEYGA